MNEKDLFDFESAFPFFKDISESDREYVREKLVFKSFKKGENLHNSTECTGVILVKSGALRVYLLSDDGKEITLYRLHKGDVCMLSASCVLHSITFDVFVDAESDSECYILSGCAFSTLCDLYPSVKIYALETALSRFSDVMWVMQQILFMSFDKRLAIFLLDELSENGGENINLTHEQIAKHLGSAREVVSRMLKYFSTEGLVEVSRKGVRVLDKNRLYKLTL